jgi:hypothetical protein
MIFHRNAKCEEKISCTNLAKKKRGYAAFITIEEKLTNISPQI